MTVPMNSPLKLLRLLTFLACFIAVTAMAAQPASHTKGTPTGHPTGPLKPGEYWWNPAGSPNGPVVVLISLPLQTLSVYRNGVLVGRSSVSTGTKGHSTPTGVFTILEKKETHYSNLYKNAPMPNMQRLTWSGICMHSGNLPGYPASHGCIRMPYDFSKLLFSITSRGCTVVIGDENKPTPHFAANPGVLLAPRDFKPEMLKPLAPGEYQWKPELSTSGPITILVSSADRELYVYRNGIPIGRAALDITNPRKPLGGHTLTLLEGVTGKASPWAPGQPGRNWMNVPTDDAGRRVSLDDLAKRVRISPDFAAKLDDLLTPGATIVVTDDPAIRRANPNFSVLTD